MSLAFRAEDDPMRLFWRIIADLKNSFRQFGLKFLPGQLEALEAVVEAVLTASPSTVTAIPLVPGGGKSTLLRSILKVLAELFGDMSSPIAQRIGGIIVVVEKSAEAHELEQVCSSVATHPVSTVIESANDFNLGQGLCPNGTATCYVDCLHRTCPDYATCPLMAAAGRTQETPILFLLHARYQQHMENVEPFLTWYDGKQEFRRTLLLVDELPDLFQENAINLRVLNDAESELDEVRPSYYQRTNGGKHTVLFQWNKQIRTPFFKLVGNLSRKMNGQCRLVRQEDMQTAGFDLESLTSLLSLLTEYAPHSQAESMVRSLLGMPQVYFSMGQTATLFLPRLRHLNGERQPATFLFSGTAKLSPEVAGNPDIRLLRSQIEESFFRLKICVQRGDTFNGSKTALSRIKNLNIALLWVQELLAQMETTHEKILLITYKGLASPLWAQLRQYHHVLIPYMDGTNTPKPLLPYFGGLNGSNAYQEATCVICLGLNRFEPKDYVSRAIALNATGMHLSAPKQAVTDRLEQLPNVMDIQDITLARDIAQLVFRSKLRQHGDTTPITLWLLQPPNGVLGYLQGFFPDCQITEIPDFSASCKTAAAATRLYSGSPTNAAKLLIWLKNWNGQETTPMQIRTETGLTIAQFKEARKNPEVRLFFASHVKVVGSGKNTRFRFKAQDQPAA